MKKFYLIIATIFIVAACSAPTNNSDMGMSMSMDGEPEGPHTSVEWQIWAYSTAAPEFIEGAAVYDGPPDMGGKLLEKELMDGHVCQQIQEVCLTQKMDGLILMRQCLRVVMLNFLSG